jgi:nucleoside-diphosphate-sugar epimerase
VRTQRIAVVTGGNRGLGLGTCRALARAGDRVVLTARSVEDAVEAAEALHGEGLPAVHPAQLDVTREDSVQAFFGFLQAELDDRIDVLVNNAGAIFEASGADTLDVPTDTLQQAFDTNTLGAHRMLLGALPRMNRQGYGRVVNVSSGMGGLAEMGERWPAYRLSKAARRPERQPQRGGGRARHRLGRHPAPRRPLGRLLPRRRAHRLVSAPRRFHRLFIFAQARPNPRRLASDRTRPTAVGPRRR